jgi:hypothetical protein
MKESDGEMVQKAGMTIAKKEEEGRSFLLGVNVLDPLAGLGLSIPALDDIATHNIVKVVQTKVCASTNPNLVRNTAFVVVRRQLSRLETRTPTQPMQHHETFLAPLSSHRLHQRHPFAIRCSATRGCLQLPSL